MTSSRRLSFDLPQIALAIVALGEMLRRICRLNDGYVHDSGVFLRMLLGPTNVRATLKDGRYKVKEEYNAYRVCRFHFLRVHF